MDLNPISALRPEFPFVCFRWTNILKKAAFFLLVLCLLCATPPVSHAKGFFPFNLKSMTGNIDEPEEISFFETPFDGNQIKKISQDLLNQRLSITNSGWISYALNEPSLSLADMEFEFKNQADSGRSFGKYQALADDSFTITMMAVGAIGVLYFSPDSFSNWEDKDLSPDVMGSRYSHKVGDGPVVDPDDDGINFIGHPYFGGAYYIHARKLGYQRNDAFMFSFLMSTFMYEYGVEAFFERPSMQDLVTTPVAGSVVGELMVWGDRRIRANQSRVLGSKILGRVSLVLLDPIGCAINKIEQMTALFPNTHVKTKFFAYQVRAEGFDGPYGKGGSRDFRCGVEITWFRK